MHSKMFENRTSGVGSDLGARSKLQYTPVVAVVAGVSLLIGGLYFYDHLPSPPASTAYTQLSWDSTQGNIITVGRSGTKLAYEISNLQPAWAAYRVSAVWEGTSEQPLAKPLTLSVGPNKTIRGTLFVPPPPTSCVYRIAVTLVEIGRVLIRPLINNQPGQSMQTYRSQALTKSPAYLQRRAQMGMYTIRLRAMSNKYICARSHIPLVTS